MPDDATVTEPSRAALVVAVLILAGLGSGLAWWYGRPLPSLPPVPHTEAEPWMAEALYGVGPVRRDDAAAAIRAWRIDALPATAQGAVPKLFAGPADDASAQSSPLTSPAGSP